MFSRIVSYQKSLTFQQYINGLLSILGLVANLIALFSYFGAIQTSPTGSNFYVNSREYLAWFLVAFLYTFGMINAWIRRRWRRMYGHEKANNSVLNAFSLIEMGYSYDSDKYKQKWRNFQRDFSFVYVASYIPLFLYTRAVTATQTATGITGSPWGDLITVAFLGIPATIFLMIVTSMFDFAMSMFIGDSYNPKNQ